jgi:hypothetical protein
MKILIKSAFFLSVLAMIPPSLRASVIGYVGSFTDGTSTVSFSIYTDGVIGQVAASDIVDGSLSVVGGSNPFAPIEFQYAYLAGGDLTADAHNLYFEFDATDAAYYQLAYEGSDGYYNLEFQNSYDLPYAGNNILLAEPIGANNVSSPAQPAGAVEIANAPEPASAAMSLGGCMLLGFVAWERRQFSRVQVLKRQLAEIR